jgi:hypothetical protein
LGATYEVTVRITEREATMSDEQQGKKECEREVLEYFLEAYAWVTGEDLSYHPYISARESPDFVCLRSNGEAVGLELVKVAWDTLAQTEVYGRDPYRAIDRIIDLIENKESKRSKHYGSLATTTILILQTVGECKPNLRHMIDDSLQEDFSKHGFVEIWIVDWEGVKAYGDVELFGLFPEKWWGYHRRPWPDRKPYG